MNKRHGLILLLICLLVYGLANYGGPRAPDEEVVYRVAESLVQGQGFSPTDMKMWPRFGVAEGRDGNLYSIYPPVQSIIMAPIVYVSQKLADTGWHNYMRIPFSHYVDEGFKHYLFNLPTKNPRAHAERFIVSFISPLISAFLVLAFYYLMILLIGPGKHAFYTSFLFAFGTLFFPYSGTVFTESTAALFAVAALAIILKVEKDESKAAWMLISGLLMGLGIGTHVTVILFVPFLGLYLLLNSLKTENKKPAFAGLVAWCAGLALIVFMLGFFNYYRFGSFLESGRSLSIYNTVEFRMPWQGQYWLNLYHLLFSAGKGLFFFCPAVLLSIPGWRLFYKARPALCLLLAGAVVFRLFFNASYHVWHGGFCYGPRYLVIAIPILIIPVGYWLRSAMANADRKGIIIFAVATWAFICHQLIFVAGELFTYYHFVKLSFIQKGGNVFAGERLYLDWELSPIFALLKHKIGPFWLQYSRLSPITVWIICMGLLSVIVVLVLYRAKNQESVGNGTNNSDGK